MDSILRSAYGNFRPTYVYVSSCTSSSILCMCILSSWLVYKTMRVLVENYGDVRIFSTRPFGYKRYHVEWANGNTTVYSGLWYTEDKVKQIVEEILQDNDI
mgnify:FL=1